MINDECNNVDKSERREVAVAAYDVDDFRVGALEGVEELTLLDASRLSLLDCVAIMSDFTTS